MRLLLLILLLTNPIFAKPKLIVLQGKNPAAYAPISYLFNISFDTAQNREVIDQNSMRYSRIFRYMGNPKKYIERDGGMSKFFDDEFFGKNSASNYALHLVGGGFDFRYLYEWYTIKGYSYPWIMAALTSYAGNITNEALETSYDKLNSHDHIADLYFFDIVSKLLFTSDAIAGLFYNTFGMRSWTGMPMLDSDKMQIYNASLNYFIRFGQGWARPFLLWGLYQMGGVSLQLGKALFITPTVGIFLLDPLEGTFKVSSALFLDYNDRLLTSFHINGGENMDYKFCIYPPLLSTSEKINFGLMLGRTSRKEFSFGITLHTPIGMGRSRSFY